jgi:hypothetical protein
MLSLYCKQQLFNNTGSIINFQTLLKNYVNMKEALYANLKYINSFKFIAKTRVQNMSPAEVTFLTNPVCSKCYYIRIDNDDCKHFYLHTKSNVDRKRVNTIFYIYETNVMLQ